MSSIPGPDVMKWVAEAIGRNAKVVGMSSLHGEVSPWLLHMERGGVALDVVLRIPVEDRISPEGICTNMDALMWAEQYALPTPRLIAFDRTGNSASVVASLETALPGTSDFPDKLNAEQLQRVGATIARVHSIRMTPHASLRKRTRPIQPDDFARDRRWAALLATTPDREEEILRAYSRATGRLIEEARALISHSSSSALLLLADEYVRMHGAPTEPTVLVHGDLWPGNTRWLDGTFSALIDWKTSGVGSPGVDLGSMRMQVAVRYGLNAADYIREGWESQMGQEATHVPYWVAVAALNTPEKMGGWPNCDPESHPLGSRAVTARRDQFLSQAIDQLQVHRDREHQETGWG